MHRDEQARARWRPSSSVVTKMVGRRGAALRRPATLTVRTVPVAASITPGTLPGGSGEQPAGGASGSSAPAGPRAWRRRCRRARIAPSSCAPRATPMSSTPSSSRSGQRPRGQSAPSARGGGAGRLRVCTARRKFWFGDADESLRTKFLDTAPMHRRRTDAFLIARHETTYREWVEFLDGWMSRERAGALRAPPSPRRCKARCVWEQGRPHLAADVSSDLAALPPRGRASRSSTPGAPSASAGLAATSRRRRLLNDTSGIQRGLRRDRPRAGRPPLHRVGVGARRARRGRARVTPRRRSCAQRRQLRPHLRQGARRFRPRRGGQPPPVAEPRRRGRHGRQRSWSVGVASLPKPGEPMLRGGGYYYGEPTARSSNRTELTPGLRDPTLGLRVCADATLK